MRRDGESQQGWESVGMGSGSEGGESRPEGEESRPVVPSALKRGTEHSGWQLTAFSCARGGSSWILGEI